MAAETRTPTEIDRIAERWVDTVVELSPTTGTYIGRREADERLPDLSPEGAERVRLASREALAAIRAAEPVDAVDLVTATDLGAELELALEEHDAQLHLRDLNVIASPAQDLQIGRAHV